MVYKSLLIFGEADWQIDIPLSEVETEDEARTVADLASGAQLVLIDQIPAIEVRVKSEILHYYDDDIVITEISQEKQAQLGPPLDVRNPNNKQVAINALLNHDPAYTLEEEDMVPSDKTLADFLERCGVGYRLEAIAYGIA